MMDQLYGRNCSCIAYTQTRMGANMLVCFKSNTPYVCDNLYEPENHDALNNVQKWSSHWIMGCNWMLSIPAMISAPFLGSWSDMYGRKMPILLPSIGGALSSLVLIASSVYVMCPIEVLLLASFISGIFGSFSSCLLTCMSYLSQISTNTSRTWRLGILESMTFIAASFGPFLAGSIQYSLGRPWTFIIMMILHILTVFYICFFVDELHSRPVEDQISFKNLFSCKRSQEALTTVCRYRQENRRTFIITILVIGAVTMFASAGERDITYIFVKDTPIKWNLRKYSNYLSIKSCIGAVSLLLLKFFSCLADGLVLCVGLLSKIGGLILLGVARSSVPIYLSAVASSLNTWCILAVRSSISKMVETDEQGKAFAFIAVMESLSGLVAAGVFNTLYPITRSFFSGFMFLLAAIILVGALIAAWYIHISIKNINVYGEIVEPPCTIEEDPTSEEISIEDHHSIN